MKHQKKINDRIILFESSTFCNQISIDWTFRLIFRKLKGFKEYFTSTIFSQLLKNIFALKYLSFSFFLSICLQGNAEQSKLDFSGVDAFWKVATQLKQGIQPSETEWEQFFSTRYYSYYSYGSIKQKSSIKLFFTNAFLPDKKQYLDSVLSGPEDNYLKQMYLHVIQAEKLKVELQMLINKINKSHFTDSITALCQQLLPKGTTARIPSPIISFGIYLPDANGSSNGIFFDLKLASNIPYFELVVAHEAHHYYTYNSRLKLNIDSSIETILNVVSQLQVEGIADQIDKPNFLSTKGSGFPAFMYHLFYTHYQNPIPSLKKMDSLLIQIFHQPETVVENSKIINALLPLGTHPYAFYMSETIKSVYGKKGLISVVNNPFDFIRLYNKAAQEKDLFRFSEQTMAYLTVLEKRVMK